MLKIKYYDYYFWIIVILVLLTMAMDIHSYHLQRDLDNRSKNIEQNILYIQYELQRMEQNASTPTN